MRDEDQSDPRALDVEDEFGAALRGEEPGEETKQPSPPVTEDLAALVQDGRNFVEAEVAFQKTRLAFAANRSKSAVLAGLFALGFIHLALIALVVGLLIALTPLVTAWGATAIVVGLLLLGAAVLGLKVRNSANEIGQAFESTTKDEQE